MNPVEDPYYSPTVPEHVPQALVHDFNAFDHESEDPYRAVENLFRKGVPEIFWTRHYGGHWVLMGTEAIAKMAETPLIFSSRRWLVPDSQNLLTSSCWRETATIRVVLALEQSDAQVAAGRTHAIFE